MIAKRLLILVLLISSYVSLAQDGSSGRYKYEVGNIHVLSIGIDAYPKYPLKLCVSDSDEIVAKIEDLKNTSRYPIGEIFVHKLNDNNASLANIRNAFKKIISESKVNDYFIFFFGGFTVEDPKGETFIVPYDLGIDLNNQDFSKMMPLVEMARLMEQIQSGKQLVISEAGSGEHFAENLITQLFESNPLIAAGTERNRVILTTKGLGIEGSRCPDGSTLNNGYLTRYILDSGDILDAFYDIRGYEYRLIKAEVSCSLAQRKYFSLYQEKEFRNIIIKNFGQTGKRGSGGVSTKPEKPQNSKPVSENHAIMIATTEYGENSDWKNLKNPINDAEDVGAILKARYNTKIHKFYNKTKEEILSGMIDLKSQISENDKLIVFVAGHGYYSDDYSDGHIVLKDSRSLKQDFTLNSYIQMATLNRFIDNMPSKNIFAIFDVCFGASFDLNGKDVALSNYNGMTRDITLDEFIARKSKENSRIFMASGRYEVPDYWKSSLRHSPFANKLIKVLDNADEFISPGKIFATMEGNATEPILKQFGKHEVRGEFLLKVQAN